MTILFRKITALVIFLTVTIIILRFAPRQPPDPKNYIIYHMMDDDDQYELNITDRRRNIRTIFTDLDCGKYISGDATLRNPNHLNIVVEHTHIAVKDSKWGIECKF